MREKQKTTPKKPLKGYGVRADEDKMLKAEKYGIDIGETFRRALDKKLLKHEKACPTCGHPRVQK